MQSHLYRGAAGRGLVQGPSRRTCAPIAQLGAQPNPLSGAPAPVPNTPLAAASSSSPSILTSSTSSSSNANPTQRLILGPQPASSNGRGRLVLPGSASPSAVHVAAAPLRSSTAAPGPSSSGSSSSTTTTVQHDSKGSPIVYFGNQRVHSLTDTGREVIHSMSGWAETTLPRYLKPAEVNWQPQDLLPESSSDTFFDEVAHLRANAASLPDDYLVVLVGDMITEEALPSYMNMLNLLDETKDETGASPSPWAAWTRAWTGEENRHGDLLNRYLYLSGRVDMRRIEESVQRLIGSGLDPQLENNPYLCFVYTSFQERATRISHGNTARLAMYHGDRALAKICGLIAADEARHEAAYTAIVSEFLARDPEGALLAFEDMMKKGILMPAHYVDDGWHAGANNGQNLFVDYATVADSIGVYTTQDYAAIVDHLVKKWDIANLQGLSGRAAEAQEYLCKHSERIRRLADLQMERRLREKKRGRSRSAAFSWIFGKEVSLV